MISKRVKNHRYRGMPPRSHFSLEWFFSTKKPWESIIYFFSCFSGVFSLLSSSVCFGGVCLFFVIASVFSREDSEY